MASFYTKEKAKHGTMTGSIISFPIEIREVNPKDPVTRKLLPAGYLRCDGSVQFAREYPELAIVLGVGLETKYAKDGQVLTNDEFQLPDLRNKHIRATTSSNIGLYNDLTVQDANDQTQFKSGIGLDVVQNIDSPYQLNYTGDFYIPPQTIELRGEPRFTVDTGVYTATAEVPQNAFQPHLHRTSTNQHRQKDNSGNFFRTRQRNHKSSVTTLNICPWFTNTAQPLCKHQWENEMQVGRFHAVDQQQGAMDYDYYGACFSGCLNFGTAGYCLWPEQGLCADEPEAANQWQNVTWQNRQANEGDGADDQRYCGSAPKTSDLTGNEGPGQGVTFGNIFYETTLYQKCDCGFVIFDNPINCDMDGQDNTAVSSSVLENYGPNNNYPGNYESVGSTAKNLPFSSNDDENYGVAYSGVTNTVTLSGENGNDGSHRHRIGFDSDEEHTYKMITRAGFARADSGLVSKITIEKNNSKKADKYIQPYIVTEYLIKI